MKSRMDKYYSENELMQRTSKNDSLYDELYREKQTLSDNMVVLNDADEIDINKIKSMIDSRENYKRAKRFENVVSPTNNNKDEEIDYKFDEIDDSNYDINEIIEKKRSTNEEENRVRKLDTKYESTMEELSEEFLTHEQQLRDLFDTVTQTNLAKTDLFSNLREDDSEKTKDETKEEEFYTNTSKLEKEDFDDEFLEKSSNAKVFIIITIILMIIAIGVILYLKVFK
ncbi:MAG: hypothetical protein PUJ60_05475 [bacterium]|nr:hypothetical protein [bacterium]MDY4108735.1 hypothetical protein [Bacilli bacterium]